MRVGGVLVDPDVGGVAEDLVEHVVGLALGGDDDLRAVGSVLVGHVRVRRQSFMGEVPVPGSESVEEAFRSVTGGISGRPLLRLSRTFRA